MLSSECGVKLGFLFSPRLFITIFSRILKKGLDETGPAFLAAAPAFVSSTYHLGRAEADERGDIRVFGGPSAKRHAVPHLA